MLVRRLWSKRPALLPVASHRPRSTRAVITSRCSQPAWQRTSTLPSLPELIERLGARSSCTGQRAIHVAPARCPPSALAMVSAVIAHLALIRLGGRSCVIGDKPFGSRPFGEQTEETGN